MKRILINDGKVGLVFRNGNFKQLLTAGKHWIGFYAEVFFYDLSKRFSPIIDLNILLQNADLAAALEVVEVADNELVFRYENGNFKEVLKPGRYAFWKGMIEHKFVYADLSKKEITEDIDLRILQQSNVSPYLRIFVVENYEKGMLYTNGKFERDLETGIHYFWKTPTVISLKKADMRKLQTEVLGQEILTKDKAALRANFVVQYRIVDMQKAVIETNDYVKQLYVLTQMAVREYMSAYTLDEVLERKEAVGGFVKKALSEQASDIGLEIVAAGIKDIILPGDIKEIMNQVLVAQKQAQANTITRREETASTRSLLNTAKLMEENEMLFRLKEMEYTEKIADKINGISLSGGGQVLDQLRDIFVPQKG